jgi:hypothetical protein
VTLFSARNYFGREENDAALLMVARDGYGQIRVRPKRLPAYVSGAHPSLGAPSTSQRRRRSRSGSPKRRRSRSSSPYTSDDDEADVATAVATTAGALDAAFAETPPPPPPKAHFSPSPKVHSSLGL